MASFFEQFREFLAPRYQLLHELGSGGGGRVFLARDTMLSRSVAVKALDPEKAGAEPVDRFLREARILAGLEHPNIVPIYDVGRDTDPFIYYIMQYLDGESLADRLKSRGPLEPREVTKLGRDLLNALKVTHARGVIHRDIKPGNIFWLNGRGVLTDFGVAKSLTHRTDTSSAGATRGTWAYMPPEQLAGNVVPQTDLYALGMVLYEALTGVRWETGTVPERGDWTRVPSEMRPALRRALALSAEDRWPNAEAFERALWGKRVIVPPVTRNLTLATAGVVVIWRLFPRLLCGLSPSRCTLPADVRIDRISVTGAEMMPGLGDSMTTRLTDLLTRFPDLRVAGPAVPGRAKATVTGSAMADSGSILHIQLRMTGEQLVALSMRVDQWRAAADMLADSILVRLYRSSPLDADLPVRVLPRDPEGLRSFLAAEKAFARASWDEAYRAYGEAARIDPTCALCFWRHAEVARFYALPPDTTDAVEYRARIGEFPPNYQTLIGAELVPLDQRLDSLDALARRASSFLFGPFRWGDELLHRGPLVGEARLEASVGFIRATEIRRDFVPAWEHLAWLRIAEGDEREAGAALDTLRVLPPPGPAEIGMRDLLQVAYAWRFRTPAEAAAGTAEVLTAAAARDSEPLDAGARYLNHFGAPQGAVWLGQELEQRGYHPISAILAQAFGDLSAGRPAQARRVLGRGVAQYGDQDLGLLAPEIDAVRLIFDADSLESHTSWTGVDTRLRDLQQRLPSALRPRAAWMRSLLARRFGAVPPPPSRDTPAPLVQLLDAYDVALRGRFTEALQKSEPLLSLRPEAIGDPTWRTVLHLLRAEWQVRIGQPLLADGELLWYENSDAIGLPQGDAQPMEVDWAFGTLARWRRVQLGASKETRCAMAGEVTRLWTGAEPAYAARADTARAIARECRETAS